MIKYFCVDCGLQIFGVMVSMYKGRCGECHCVKEGLIVKIKEENHVQVKKEGEELITTIQGDTLND